MAEGVIHLSGVHLFKCKPEGFFKYLDPVVKCGSVVVGSSELMML